MQGMTPTTPPLSMIYAFRAALGMMADEGIERSGTAIADIGSDDARGHHGRWVTIVCPARIRK